MKIKRKQIAFDIDTKVAEQILGENYNKLYDGIKRFAIKNNFTHIQGSVYTSNQPMTNLQVYQFLQDLKSKYPYLDKCVRDIRQTDITNEHSLNKYFNYDGTPGEYVKDIKINLKNTDKKTMSSEEMKNFVNDIKNNRNERIMNSEKSISKKNERDR